MKQIPVLLTLLAFLMGPVRAQETDEASLPDPHAGEVIVVVPVGVTLDENGERLEGGGVIDEGVRVIVRRAVDEAKAMNAKAMVLRIDTPGGRVDSAVAIASAISDAPFRTIAYIEGMGAISAGALISFACDDIIMTPGSAIGAATPVYATPEGTQPTGEKEVSFMRAKMRALAEANGHNPDLAQAMVDKDIELRGYRNEQGDYIVFAASRVTGDEDSDAEASDAESARDQAESPAGDMVRRILGDTPLEQPVEETPAAAAGTEALPQPKVPIEDTDLVLASGKLLTMTPSEAEKYGLIPTTVESLDDAIRYYQLGGGTYHIIEPTWAETVFKFLTNPTVAGLLLLIGLGGLYFEVQTPGFGIPGIVGIIALSLLFGSHFVLGLTETIDVVLILAGVLLLLAELLLIPGFGIAGMAGIVCILLGTYLALVDFTIPEYSWDYDRLGEVGYSLSLALILFMGLVIITWRLLPRTPLYRALVVGETQQTTEGYTSPIQDVIEPRTGMRGVTVSMLRPVGRARFGDATLQVVSRGAYIPKGTEVEIIQIDGSRVIVERTGEEA